MNKPHYIIIGAGSAGCVLANRLSADLKNQVLLFEAGGPDTNPFIAIPGGYTKLNRTKVDWGFSTEPQTYVLDRKMYLPRGKTLGGCSSTNAMAYVRGNRADYDGWAELGNEGWDYESILPYFIKSEGNENFDEVDQGYHGKDGELHVSSNRLWKSPFVQPFINACDNIGISQTSDYNGKSQTGVSRLQYTIKNGKRYSGADAFLKPVLNRPNLQAITKARVTKIIVENNTAVGVEYIRKKKKYVIRAEKEIILSAGSFQSPQILMLSGVGDPDELKQHNIECKHELNGVGKNLQDHLFFPVSATTHLQGGLNHSVPILQLLKEGLNYFIRNKGPLTVGALEAVAFFDVYQKGDCANFQIHFAPLHLGKGYETDLYDINTFPTNDGISILPTLLYPKSRGYVGLNSKDPMADPLIQPNFFSHEDDLDQLVRGTKIALDVINQAGLKTMIKEIVAPLDISTDEAIIKHIKKSVETVYHPVGTCKMGSDEMAVVDSQLRVHGINNLRIADASIMPKIVGGNTNAPVYMIAEKAADMLLS